MKKIDIVSSVLFNEPQKITDEIVEYYRKNPAELDLIIDKEHFQIKFLSFFFILGLLLTLGSRILKYLFEDDFGPFINDVIIDVSSELGIAIFGGAITAFLLEYLQKRQYQQNLKFRNEIKARITMKKKSE